MGCGKSCAKVLLIIFNVFFWLTGIALLAFGIYLAVDERLQFLQGFVSPGDPLLKTAGYVLCGVGSFIFIVGFCGCCGAWKENVCLLSIYVFCVTLVMLAELAAGIYVGVRQQSVLAAVGQIANETISVNYGNETAQRQNGKKAVDGFQRTFNCCGVGEPSDWAKVKNWATGLPYGNIRPASCCIIKEADNDDKEYNICIANNNYVSTGCLPKILSLLHTYFPAVIAVACSIGVLEIFGIVFAIILCKSDKD